MTKKANAFTIVELLIVIVVIAILAAISVVAYTGIQERANKSKVKQDIAQIIKAITIAREQENKVLLQITGSSATGGQCWGKASGTDLATLPKATDTCWTRYATTLDAISTASGMDIRNIVDPWGRPYLIDENEGEGGSCARDTVGMHRLPLVSGFGLHSWTPSAGNVRLGGFTGCS